MTNTSTVEAPLAPATDGTIFEILPHSYDDKVLTCHFRGDIFGVSVHFLERIDFAALDSAKRPSEHLLNLLTLACSLSYYKATLADTIKVRFPITGADAVFFRTLIEHGLGEYAYVNDVPWKLAPRLLFEQSEQTRESMPWNFDNRPLVAVGGGKDSIVAIEALKDSGFQPLLFSVNGRGAISSSIRVSGCDSVTVVRQLDHGLIEANARGALNGHVPVTAINSLIGLVTAELAGCGPVIFANEESADYGNLVWHERTINHQWSKSLEFEDLLRTTLREDGLSPDRYFSILRGYREIEIARDFARHPEYFDSFTSCNRAYVISSESRSASWCGECPKCAFVFLILAPYINRARLVEIFGNDLLSDTSLRGLFLDILGVGGQKPFECVGEPSEAIEALTQVLANGEWRGEKLVDELAISIDPLAGGSHSQNRDRVPAPYSKARGHVGEPA